MGGGLLRVVGRNAAAALGGAQETISAARPRPTALLSVNPPSSSVSMPVSAAASTANGCRSSPLCSNEGDEWEAIEKGYGATESAELFIFGPVPSRDEVEDAVSALQQVFVPVTRSQIPEERLPHSSQIQDSVRQMASLSDFTSQNSSTERQSGWIEASGLINETLSERFNNVLDAFRLLQTNPSVQRMVVSLSSDKAVWDAVMNNEVVQELRESFYAATKGCLPNSNESRRDAANHLKWIAENMKGMIMELIDRITALVDQLFGPPQKEDPMNIFNETIRSSFMLSIMVLFVVVMTRVQNA